MAFNIMVVMNGGKGSFGVAYIFEVFCIVKSNNPLLLLLFFLQMFLLVNCLLFRFIILCNRKIIQFIIKITYIYAIKSCFLF